VVLPEQLPAERWATVERLFLAALDLPAFQREAFINSECGPDGALRDEVISLLRCDSGGEATLVDALRAEAGRVISREPAEGSVLGSWRVEREIGRGGMSVVYLGSRADGEFSKFVALKVIKRGMDTDLVIARMRRERGILASLDHPCISRLLDGGTTGDGLPWIAMEYVDGAAIDLYCEQLTQITNLPHIPLPDYVFRDRPFIVAIQHVHDADLLHRYRR
jgi:eukaryotic-like serine/threonine-protein kinase